MLFLICWMEVLIPVMYGEILESLMIVVLVLWILFSKRKWIEDHI
jgi:hypothetical protein